MRWNTLLVIMTTISRKPMSLPRTPISRRTPISTMRSKSCVTRLLRPLRNGADVIIVASVSCIYGLGSPVDYENQVLSLRPGMAKNRHEHPAKAHRHTIHPERFGNSNAEAFGSGAISSTFSLPAQITQSVWNCSATKSK